MDNIQLFLGDNREVLKNYYNESKILLGEKNE